MLQKNEALARLRALAEKSGVKAEIADFKDSLTDAAISKHKVGGWVCFHWCDILSTKNFTIKIIYYSKDGSDNDCCCCC